MMEMASLQDVCDSGMYNNLSSDPRNARVLVKESQIYHASESLQLYGICLLFLLMAMKTYIPFSAQVASMPTLITMEMTFRCSKPTRLANVAKLAPNLPTAKDSLGMKLPRTAGRRAP